MISQTSQSCQRNLALTLENWRGHFSRTLSLCFAEFYLFLSCRLRKFVTSLLGYLGSFGVFILAKFCGSFNKFNTYFLRSLDSNLFFVNGFFTKCLFIS